MNALLSTHGLKAGYGDMRALHGIEISIAAGETVALIGANGAGKSTLLKAIMGVLPVAPEMIMLDGKAVGGKSPHLMVKAGVAIVPEGPFQLIYAFEAVIIGGLGSIWGTFTGAMILGISQSIGFRINPGFGILAGHLVFLAVLVVRPQGIFKRKS